MPAAVPFADLIGSSELITRLRTKLGRLVSASETRLPPLLLQGETGTGKGLLARQLHVTSARASAPFVDFNCAAVPATLLESELFGHAEGAFTDARRGRPGLVEAADGGTLFLDEIGAMPVELQAKLLKVVEEQVVRRLGATRGESVDVWVVSASNDDLAAAVGARRFRADLYHRLAGVIVTLPPLRERGDDILKLADHFLDRVAAAHGLARPTLTADARQALLAHEWPGNVRELSNLLERVVLLDASPYITARMLGLSSSATTILTGRSRPEVSGDERTRILAALEATGWNVSQAADWLGLSRNTLRYRMERFGFSGVSSPRRRPKGFRWEGPGRPIRERRVAVLGLRIVLGVHGEQASARAVIASLGGRIEEVADGRVLAVFGLRPNEQALNLAAEAGLTLVGSQSQGCTAAAIDIVTLPITSRSLLSRQERAAAIALLRPLVERAETGSVLVSPAAAALLERHFSVQSLSSDSPTEAFRLVAPAPSAGVEPQRPATPFVGREDDLALLGTAAEEARSGRGQVIGVIGDAGGGKSRLLHEFRHLIGESGMRWVVLTCVAHADSVPYQPVVAWLRQRWDLDAARSPALIAATVRERVHECGLAVDLATACLLRLMGVPGADGPIAGLAPEAIGRTIADLLRALLVSREGPQILVVEDLHWADHSTQELVGAIVGMASLAAIFVVTTYRPGYQPPWIDRSGTTQLALAPLTPSASTRLVRAILADDTTPQIDVDKLVARGHGNPLFLEELAWSVQRGTPAGAGQVPDSIEGALAARLGPLSPVARRLLSIAAVLGSEMPRHLLHEIAGERESRRPLDELTRKELLRADLGVSVCSFRHPLIREVCYARLPEDERRRLHAAAAAALERLWAGREEEVLDGLARHYAGAGQPDRAIPWLTRLAARATATYALAEAVEALERALTLARSLPATSERDREIVRIVQLLARPLILLGRLIEVRDLLTAHRKMVQLLADSRLLCAHEVWLAMAHDHLGDPDTAVSYASEALRLAMTCGETVTAGRARMLLSFAGFWAGDFRQSIEYATHAAMALDTPEEILWGGMAVYVAAMDRGLLGEFEAALATADELRRIGERAGDRRLESYAHHLVGWIAGMRGDTATAVAACARSVEIAPDPLAVEVTLYFLGEARLVAGDCIAACADLERVLDLNAHLRFAPLESLALAALAEAQLRVRSAAAAQVKAGEALAIAERIRFTWGQGRAHRVLGRVAHAAGDRALAAKHLRDSIEIFTRVSARWEMDATARLLDDILGST
jgi:two-component system response regulator AtoC